jgi:hypothetical protein
VTFSRLLISCFVVRLIRFDERETDERLTLWTRAKGNERCGQTYLQHRMSLAPSGHGPNVASIKNIARPIRIDNHTNPSRFFPMSSNPATVIFKYGEWVGNQPLPDFEDLGFLLSAPGTSEYAAIKPRFAGVDLPQHHRRRALRTCEFPVKAHGLPEKAHESPEKARTLGYRLCRHVLPSCLQAGVLQNSQPPTPDQRSLSVMTLPWALIRQIARRLSTSGARIW